MPAWLQILVASCTVLAFIGGIIGWIWHKSHKAKTIADRPYPCPMVQSLKEAVEEHDGYLSKDRKRLEDLEKAEIRLTTQYASTSQDIKDIKSQNQQIINLLIKGKME